MEDLTIIMPSYNKAKYIKEAIESVLMQKTTYTYKIVIADDCSTDDTVQIANKYKEKYPEKFEILTSDKNLKLYKNVLRAYAITKTDYFCVLDPDDFWIDEYKIQKSLDFLEKNKEYTIYVTNTMQQTSDGKRNKWSNIKAKDSDFNDYLNGSAALGCTLGSMYRNVIFQNGLPEKMIHLENVTCEKAFRGDSFRNAIHIHEGKAHSVTDYDAVYRITGDGLWQSSSEFKQNLLNANIYIDLYKYFDSENIELLLIAYRIYNKSIKPFLENIDDKDIDAYKNIVTLVKANKVKLDSILYKNIKPKYKIMYKMYKFSYKKLSKKGLI